MKLVIFGVIALLSWFAVMVIIGLTSALIVDLMRILT